MTAAKKKPTKAAPKEQQPEFAIIRTEVVPIKGLSVYYKNPRIGDVSKIAKSLHINKQFKPIVVNVGTHTGRPNEILAGNHTYLGARKELSWKSGNIDYYKPVWTHIYASFVDVDEEEAKRIVLADNATAEGGSYDEELRKELLLDLPDISGAGFTDVELEDMGVFADLEDLDLDSLSDDIEDFEDDRKASRTFDGSPLGEEDEAEDADGPSFRDQAKAKEDGQEITKQSDELKGAFDLKDDAYFDGAKGSASWWNIPRLRADLLMTPDDLPDKLKTWAGSATRNEEDPDVWWWYNYGVDSTSGMQDISKVIVAFYTFDEYFEGWWHNPGRYVSKLLNSKIKYAATPDFSDDTSHGPAFCMWQLFRARWLGRYFQEAGIKIIPNISWPFQNIEFLRDYTLPTLPENIPMICMQMQTYSDDLSKKEKQDVRDELQMVMDTLKPQHLILYSGKPGAEFFNKKIDSGDTTVQHLLNRQAYLSEARKGKTKKTTL